mmetsp:Transcript_46317/g.75603  ORF Transcript_46317/g.75603 Transcript_46317/m.75603 type:complete len:761 (-) Transcript_46317:524-2806(-)
MLSQIDARESASREVQQLLSLPDHLSKLGQLKTDFSRKKAAADSQLSAAVQSQAEEAREGLKYIVNCFDTLAHLGTNFVTIDELCKEHQGFIENYSQVREVCIARTNLEKLLVDLKDIFYLSEEAKKLEKMIREEDDFTKAESRLLYLHGRIYELERLRNTCLNQIMDQPKAYDFLDSHLQPVVNLSEKLANVLWLHIDNSLSLAQDNPARLITVLRVIERQEKIDKHVVEKAGGDKSKVERLVKNYQAVCLDRLQKTVQMRFMSTVLSHGEEDLDGMIEATDQIMQDLTNVSDLMAQCFPERYNIFQLYCLWNHAEFLQLYQDMGQKGDDLPPKDILRLISWSQTYHESMSSLGMEDELLQPKLSDELEPLMQGYLHQLTGLMTQWATNIVAVDRNAQPEPDAQGHFHTPYPLDLFRMINEQIGIAKAFSSGQFLLSTVQSCADVLKSVQSSTLQQIREVWHEAEYEYLIAQVNNANMCMDYMAELNDTLNKCLEEDFQSQVNMEPVTDGFVACAKLAAHSIVDRMFSEMAEATGQFFSRPWYESDTLMPSIVATLYDFFGEISSGMVDFFFRKLAVESLDRVIECYVYALVTTKEPFRHPITTNKIEKDTDKLQEFFKQHMREKQVDAHVQVLDLLRQLMDSFENVEFVSIDYRNLIVAYSDFPISFLERFVGLRADLDKKHKSAVIENCKNMVAIEQGKEASVNGKSVPPNAGLFGRIKDRMEQEGKEPKKKADDKASKARAAKEREDGGRESVSES